MKSTRKPAKKEAVKTRKELGADSMPKILTDNGALISRRHLISKKK